jgi:hypothetical protein
LKQVLAGFGFQLLVLYPRKQPFGSIPIHTLPEVLKLLIEGWQSDVLVLLLRFCTFFLDGLVGQRLVGHATQVQVPLDGGSAQYLILAQAQCGPQFLKQHFNIPAFLVSRDDFSWVAGGVATVALVETFFG